MTGKKRFIVIEGAGHNDIYDFNSFLYYSYKIGIIELLNKEKITFLEKVIFSALIK